MEVFKGFFIVTSIKKSFSNGQPIFVYPRIKLRFFASLCRRHCMVLNYLGAFHYRGINGREHAFTFLFVGHYDHRQPRIKVVLSVFLVTVYRHGKQFIRVEVSVVFGRHTMVGAVQECVFVGRTSPSTCCNEQYQG